MGHRTLARVTIAACTAALLGACVQFGGSTKIDPSTLTEPLVQRSTPFSDMVTITLPPGESPDRADALAQIHCARGIMPQLHSVAGQTYIYQCVGWIP